MSLKDFTFATGLEEVGLIAPYWANIVLLDDQVGIVLLSISDHAAVKMVITIFKIFSTFSWIIKRILLHVAH